MDPDGNNISRWVHHVSKPSETKVLETALPGIELGLWVGTKSFDNTDSCTCCLLLQKVLGKILPEVEVDFKAEIIHESDNGLIVKLKIFLHMEPGAVPADQRARMKASCLHFSGFCL